MGKPIDVVVVGAGPAGLGLACGLLAQGIQARLVEKAAAPAATSRANFLHARGSEVLDRLDALGDLPARSVRGMQITTYLDGEPAMRLRFGDPGMRTAAPPMVISQAAVEAALRERLRGLGGMIEWGSPLVDLRQDAAGVIATWAPERRSGVAGWSAATEPGARLVGWPGSGSPG
jgi:4,5-epoxidase